MYLLNCIWATVISPELRPTKTTKSRRKNKLWQNNFEYSVDKTLTKITKNVEIGSGINLQMPLTTDRNAHFLLSRVATRCSAPMKVELSAAVHLRCTYGTQKL